MLYALHGALPGRPVGRPSDTTAASRVDQLVIEALQPFDVLQVGLAGQLLEHSGGATVRRVATLHDAISAMAQYEFDAIVLGLDVPDAWPTAAYEQIATLAGATPVLVHADVIGPMATIKQRQDRQQDVVLAAAKPAVMRRLTLSAILRSRALAEEPGARIG
jgi:DNA-binding NarL/FixJ family response regulator